jgi:predicted nucleic-acid-binding Zn-ribbon protein
MKSGTCPKCNSDEIYKGNSESLVSIRTSALHVQPATTYICIDCGYFEFYALPGFDLDRVKERFERVKK